MFSVTKTFEISYAHRLLNHPGLCQYLHGHNGVVCVTYSAETLDKEGMVCDFEQIKTWFHSIKFALDHATILQKDDPLVPVLHGRSMLLLLDKPPTAETLAEYIGLNLVNRPDKVEFWETRDNKATWHL